MIACEFLAHKIRCETNITGFRFDNLENLENAENRENIGELENYQNDTTLKLTMYADDLTVFLDGDERSMRCVMSVLDDFFHLSGLKINVTKTKAVWIGSRHNSNEILCPDLNLEWGKEFELLGVEFDNNLERMDGNFEKKLGQIEKVLDCWLYRHLTPFGKICIIKSLALSKLSHIALVIPSLSKQRLNMLTSKFFSFIWDKKPDKICRKDIIKPLKLGGLDMVQVDVFWNALKFSWYRRLITSNDIWPKILLA